jgi:hypothetical protein
MNILYDRIRSVKESPHCGRPGQDGTREVWFVGIPVIPYVPVYRVKEQSIEVITHLWRRPARLITQASPPKNTGRSLTARRASRVDRLIALRYE